MEKVSDFFSELKERLSNPLVLSFLISWCVWNYKIVIGIVFYKLSELKLDGYDSYLDLIRCESSTTHFLWFPLTFAICYTILFPLIKIGVLAIGATADTWGGKLNIWITKSYSVPVEVYLTQEEKYNKAIERVAKYTVAEKELNSKILDLEDSRATLIESINLLKLEHKNLIKFHEDNFTSINDQLEKWKHINSYNFFTGDWILTRNKMPGIFSLREPDVVKYNAKFFGNTVVFQQADQSSLTLQIKFVMSNFEQMFIQFNVDILSQVENRWSAWELEMLNRDINKISGVDSEKHVIELRRITPIRYPSET